MMLLRFFAPYPIHLRLPASLALHEAFTALSVPRRSVARCPLSLAEAATNKNNLHCSSSGKGALQLHAGHSPLARQFLRLLGGFARPAAVAAGASTKDGPLHRLPLRKRLKMIKRIDPKAQRMILVQGLGRPRCQRAQQLLKRGDPQSVSARCPLFLQQLKPKLKLWTKALTVERLPPQLYPEVAFAGRSNAGKSTLLNELCGRSGTAFVSKRPGSTQELFFFKAGSPCCLCLVDLPGYGYAEAEAAKRLQWTEMCLHYIKNRQNLRRVFLLIDSRWGLKNSDLCLLSFFERHRVPFQVVLTKADLPEQKTLIKVLQIVSEEVKQFKGCAGPPIAVSALKHRGLDPLRAEIDKLRLSKEFVIGRLKMKAANLVEARRLKKEAQALERSKRQAGGSSDSASPAHSSGAAECEQGQTDSEESNIVSRALNRWRASLVAERLAGSASSGSTPLTASFSSLWTAEDSVLPEVDASLPERLEAESSESRKNTLRGEVGPAATKTVECALDSAALSVPLPDVSCAETLLSELLPSRPQSLTKHSAQFDTAAGQSTAQQSAPCQARQPAGSWESLPSGGNTSSDNSEKHADLQNTGALFRDFDLRQPAEAAANVRDSRAEVADAEACLDCQLGNSVRQSATPPGADEAPSVSNIPEDSEHQKERRRQPFAGLKAKDWRARRVSRAAVEIDMNLFLDEASRGGATAFYLSSDVHEAGDSDSASGLSSECKHVEETQHQRFPDLTGILSATSTRQEAWREKHKHSTHAQSVLLDEETLAAEQLEAQRHTHKAEEPLFSSPVTLELGMQRCFSQKWRRELLPVDEMPESVGVPTEGKQRAKERDSADVNQRRGSGGPFRIPDEYITTREVRRKPVNKRLAFEVRLQRSHEAPRASQGEFDLGERDRSTADSLLFSAAQRRQERRLKELTRKTNRRKLTSKEMTWNVAYRKWSRWARAHPNLASQTTRLSKARLFADFRLKLERAARIKQSKQARSRSKQPNLAQNAPSASLKRRSPRELICSEAEEAVLREASRD